MQASKQVKTFNQGVTVCCNCV